MQVYVLTSRPVPSGVPAGVVVADSSPGGLLARLRAALGEGVPFSLPGTSRHLLRLDQQQAFADGTLRLAYSFTR